MKLIDTHTHLYSKEFSTDIEEVIKRAEEEGVFKFYLPSVDSAEAEAMFALEKKYPDKCIAMIALHPCSVKENYKEELDTIKHLLQQRKFAGIGETGLDFYWDTSFKDAQYQSFHQHAEWALQYKLPLILHTRNATDECMEVIKMYTGLTGIFHCFGGTLQQAEAIINEGFYLGIGGVITYKNSGLAQVIKEIDLAHIVVETDAPYLSPVPFRGKRNESSYLKYIVQKIAEIKNVSAEKVAEVTTLNAEKIFLNKN